MPVHKQPLVLDQISLHRFVELQDRDVLVPGIDSVFFESSTTQSFETEASRAKFRARWLGRYLDHDPDYVYVALGGQHDAPFSDKQVVGYLVGGLDDPAQTERFADLGYFQKFKLETARFPAQLHVNVLQKTRGHGLGQRLVEMFVRDAALKGVTGVHVVTSEGARNISFYVRSGFREVAKAEWNDRLLVFLGREISAHHT